LLNHIRLTRNIGCIVEDGVSQKDHMIHVRSGILL
jgi:hypothetical protein